MRTEHDFLGDVKVPDEAYWGVFTQRAGANFRLSGLRARPVFIHSLGRIKQSAAQAHLALKEMEADKAEAIEQAAREVAEGKFDGQFWLDVIQAGAGTPFNMNCNEVVANRALELLGRKRGDYDFIHPNNHVNKSQSSNDVIPTAIRIALLLEHPQLADAAKKLAGSARRKAAEYSGVIHTGRTHLQDAVPISLEQVFEAYAVSLEKDMAGLEAAAGGLGELGIGGTAVGTGINTHPEFRQKMVEALAKNTGLELTAGASPVELCSNMNAFLAYAQALGRLAGTIYRISNDLKLLSSGPRAGIGELRLPEVEPGSSIMPGKINPSIPEAAEMAALQAQSHAYAVEAGCRAGQLQLNTHTPLIAHNILSAQELLARTCAMMRESCVDGIRADEGRIRKHLMDGLMVATALAPKLGYARVSELIQEADRRNVPIRQVILEKKLMGKKELEIALDPASMVGSGPK